MSKLLSPGLSLAAAASWGAADFSGGIASKSANVFGVVVVAHATGLVFLTLLALVSGERVPGAVPLLWGALAGVIGAIGLAALYRALAIGKMGIVAPLSAVITAIVPLLFGFLTEGLPGALPIAGFAVALVSIWLIAAGPGAAETQGVGLAIVAGVGFGGFLLFIKLAGATAVFWPLVSARSASFLLMLAIALASGKPWNPARGRVGVMILAGILDAGANALFVLAAHSGRLDVAAVLSSLYPASTVILARVVLKEHLSRPQRVGMAAALLAVALIAAR